LATRRERLASIAEELAQKPLHGNVAGLKHNLHEIIAHFRRSPFREWDGRWCAAFVFHCCVEVGYPLPYKHPSASCSFAGVRAWLEWANLPEHGYYTRRRSMNFAPRRGDIVIYDNAMVPCPHDHMGIVLGSRGTVLRVAEGNFNNVSTVLERPRNTHVRGYIRIPNAFAMKI
jgi:hypothetical protein